MSENFKDKYTKSNPIRKFLIGRFHESIKKLCSNLEISNGLEIGCGHGYSTQFLAKFVPNLEASEHEEAIIDDAKSLNPGMRIIHESIYDLKREDNSFDMIFTLEVLEHLEDPEQAIKEIKRVGKKYAIISVPNEPWFQLTTLARGGHIRHLGNNPGHINHWSKKSFIQLLSKHFKIKKVSTPYPWTIVLVEKQ